MRAAAHGHQGCVAALLAAGADTEGADAHAHTAAHWAAAGGHEECLAALLAAGADAEAADSNGLTAFALAAGRGRVGCMERLAAAGARLDAVDNLRNTVRAGGWLHCMWLHCSREITSCAHQSSPPPPYPRPRPRPPQALHIAACNGSLPAIRMLMALLPASAPPVALLAARNSKGQTARQVAAQYKQAAAEKLLAQLERRCRKARPAAWSPSKQQPQAQRCPQTAALGDAAAAAEAAAAALLAAEEQEAQQQAAAKAARAAKRQRQKGRRAAAAQAASAAPAALQAVEGPGSGGSCPTHEQPKAAHGATDAPHGAAAPSAAADARSTEQLAAQHAEQPAGSAHSSAATAHPSTHPAAAHLRLPLPEGAPAVCTLLPAGPASLPVSGGSASSTGGRSCSTSGTSGGGGPGAGGARAQLDEGVLSELLCPITQEPMADPVLAADGETYERASIQGGWGHAMGGVGRVCSWKVAKLPLHLHPRPPPSRRSLDCQAGGRRAGALLPAHQPAAAPHRADAQPGGQAPGGGAGCRWAAGLRRLAVEAPRIS